jgi:hypothetical protein
MVWKAWIGRNAVGHRAASGHSPARLIGKSTHIADRRATDTLLSRNRARQDRVGGDSKELSG